MNKDLNKALKTAVIFGLGGAIIVPLCYEIYANLSRNIAYILLAAAIIYAAVKFCKNKLSSAMFAFVTMFVIELGLGIVSFMFIHPQVVSFLSANSEYFYLTFKESVDFFVRAAALHLIVPLITLSRAGFASALRKIKENNEAAGKYIENAFDDSFEGKERKI